jgi:hypothetical protein
MVTLFAADSRYRKLITHARAAALILRKPHVREILGVTCPSHCATRWIYDYPIMRFIFNHFDEAVPILATMDFELRNLVWQLVPLSDPMFLAVRTLQCDDGSISAVIPETNKLVKRLKGEAGVLDEPIKSMYI